MPENKFFFQAPDLENKERVEVDQSGEKIDNFNSANLGNKGKSTAKEIKANTHLEAIRFCVKCGTENTLDSKFCKKCGADLRVNDHNTDSQSYMEKTPKREDFVLNSLDEKKTQSRSLIPAIIWVIGALLILVLALYFSSLSKKTINMNDYLSYEFAGSEGYGKVLIHVDWDGIKEDYGDVIKFKAPPRDEYGFYYDTSSPIDYIEYCVSVNITPNGNLNNGDQVDIKWDIDSYLTKYVDCKIQADVQRVSVTGLDSFVQSLSEIDENTMQFLDEQAKKIFKEQNSHDEGEEILEMQSIGTYFCTAMDYNALVSKNIYGAAYKPAYNKVYLIYKVKIHNFKQFDGWNWKYDDTFDMYWYVSFDDLTINSSGDMSVDTDKYYIPGGLGAMIHKFTHGKSWEYGGYERFIYLYYDIVPTLENNYYLEQNFDSNDLISD